MLVAEFQRRHFKVVVQGSQQAHRGDKVDFPSALSFWLWSQQLVDGPRSVKYALQLADAALYQPLSLDAWIECLSYALWQLKRPAPEFLTRTEGFVAALRMYHGFVLDQVRSSAIAEFDDCYVTWHARIREI